MYDPMNEQTDLKTMLIFCVLPATVAILLMWFGFRYCP